MISSYIDIPDMPGHSTRQSRFSMGSWVYIEMVTTRWKPHLFINVVLPSDEIFMSIDHSVTVYLLVILTDLVCADRSKKLSSADVISCMGVSCQ